MAEIVACPHCQRRLEVPEQCLGQTVQCPECRHAFAAAVVVRATAPRTVPTTPRREDDPRGRGRRYEHDDGDLEADDIRWKRPPGRDSVPHRGSLILSLALIALVGGWFLFGVPFLLGPLAWYMADHDLREIRAGHMDPAGEGSTRAGYVCGIIATGFLALAALICCLTIAADRRF